MFNFHKSMTFPLLPIPQCVFPSIDRWFEHGRPPSAPKSSGDLYRASTWRWRLLTGGPQRVRWRRSLFREWFCRCGWQIFADSNELPEVKNIKRGYITFSAAALGLPATPYSKELAFLSSLFQTKLHLIAFETTFNKLLAIEICLTRESIEKQKKFARNFSNFVPSVHRICIKLRKVF